MLSVLGLISIVEDESGVTYQCATRRLLKTLATDQRHVVAAGDWVLFRPVENTNPKEGLINGWSRGTGVFAGRSAGGNTSWSPTWTNWPSSPAWRSPG